MDSYLIGEHYKKLFRAPPEVWVRAPGRIELMVSHTYYRGGFAASAAIDRYLVIAGTARADEEVMLYSRQLQEGANFSVDYPGAGPHPGHWSNYARAVVHAIKEAGYRRSGFDAVVDSNIEAGSGLSSSAAFEAAMARFVLELSGEQATPSNLARLCHFAETRFVGVPCGILDQYSVFHGREGHGMLIDCLRHQVEQLPLPADWSIVICPGTTRHELADSGYMECHADAMAGAQALGVAVLAEASAERLEAIADQLEPRVLQRCRFFYAESQRTRDWADAVRAADAEAVGALMHQSFEGACNQLMIILPEIATLFEILHQGPGLIGCRQTGGGFGGAMVALVHKGYEEAFIDHADAATLRIFGQRVDCFTVNTTSGTKVMD